MAAIGQKQNLVLSDSGMFVKVRKMRHSIFTVATALDSFPQATVSTVALAAVMFSELV